MLAPRIFLCACALALSPAASASGDIGTPILELEVRDQFGDECYPQVAGFCIFNTSLESESPGEWEVDARIGIEYVSVASNASVIEALAGPLPDESVRVDLREPVVRHSVFRLASESLALVPPSPADMVAHVSLDACCVTLDYLGPNTQDLEDGLRDRRHQIAFVDGAGGIGYDHLGPFNDLGFESSDILWRFAFDPACRRVIHPACNATADGFDGALRSATPSVFVGFHANAIEAGTDPQALAGLPHAASTPPPPVGEFEAPEASRALAQTGDVSLDPEALHAGAPAIDPEDPRPRATTDSVAPLRAETATIPQPSPPTFPAAVVAGSACAAVALIFLALYRRILNRDLAKQETRARFLSIVEQEPGIRASALAERLGVRAFAVTYHARLLGRAGAIHVRAASGEVRYYPPSASVPEGSEFERAASAAHPVARVILEGVPENGAVERTRLVDRAHAAGHPPRTAQWHVRRLIERGILRRVGSDLVSRNAPP